MKSYKKELSFNTPHRRDFINITGLAEQCLVLPDYKSNPKVATLEDVGEILKSSYKR